MINAKPLNEYEPTTKVPKRPRLKVIVCLSVGVIVLGSILIGLATRGQGDGTSSSSTPSTSVPEGSGNTTSSSTPAPSTESPRQNIIESTVSPAPTLIPTLASTPLSETFSPTPTEGKTSHPSLNPSIPPSLLNFTASPETAQPILTPTAPPPPLHLTLRPPLVVDEPTISPTLSPVTPNSEPTDNVFLEQVTYRPGYLTVQEHGVVLSQGLTIKVIAKRDRYVEFVNRGQSPAKFHERPDFGATFPVPRTDKQNPGGWVYVLNSEMKETGKGGVGAITFDRNGNVIDYKMILTGSTMNCGGGRTPWNTWISCEERDKTGNIYQVDPFGKRRAQITSVGAGHGRFESFAHDVRNRRQPRFFATEDKARGALRRFTPKNPDWKRDPWQMLHGEGTLDYLVLHPKNNTFEWVPKIETAKESAKRDYPESEGIDVDAGILYFVSKRLRDMIILDLDRFTYTRQSTQHGLFDGQPDQIQRLLEDGNRHHDMLYFTEEAGHKPGIHGRDPQGRFFTILERAGKGDETTGLTFSPDGRHLYFCFQNAGIVHDVTRLDGLPFHGKTLNTKYHNGPFS